MAIRHATFEFDTAGVDVGVSGDEVGFADGLSGLTSQTHEQNLNVPNGFVSIAERLAVFSRTRLGRLTMFAAMSLPALPLAACNDGMPANPGDRPPAATASPNGEGQGGGKVLQDGDVLIISRAECIVSPETTKAYAAFTAAEQLTCQEEIAALPAEKVEKLSPLSQARWMAYYRKHKLGTPGAMMDVDLKTFDTVFKEPASRDGMASIFLLLHGNNVAAMAWHMQQPDGRGEDPRTRWALFGPGTTADSDAYKQAKNVAGNIPAGHKTLEQYVNTVPSRMGLLYDNGTIGDIAARQNADHTWDYTFTAAKTKGGARQTFHYRFIPYLGDDPTALSKGDLYEVTPPDSEFLGDTLAILPIPTTA